MTNSQPLSRRYILSLELIPHGRNFLPPYLSAPVGRRDRFLPVEADGDLSAPVPAHAVGDVGPAEADGDLS